MAVKRYHQEHRIKNKMRQECSTNWRDEVCVYTKHMKGRDAGRERILSKFILRNYHMRLLADIIGT